MSKRFVLFFALVPLFVALLIVATPGEVASAHRVVTQGTSKIAVFTPLSLGGCKENTSGLFEMGICISDRNTMHTVYPDVYVNTTPTEPFICTMYIELWDNAGHKLFQDAGHACTVGHYNSTRTDKVSSCILLHTSVWVALSSTRNFLRIGDSPSYKYC